MNSNADLPSPLETPGTIAVVGGGLMGVEAALYGRYLGYDVRVYEAETIGCRWVERGDDDLPMLPDRSYSPLAAAALSAQTDDRPETLPTRCGNWVERLLRPISGVDLLRDRVSEHHRVTRIEETEAEVDEDGDPIPPDYRLFFDGDVEPVVAEAVIVATGGQPVETDLTLPREYWFEIAAGETGDAEADVAAGLDRIREVYANLADREDLDLYQRRRGA